MTKTRDMRAEWEAIERQANGPVKPPRKVEVGSEESAFDEPPGQHTYGDCSHRSDYASAAEHDRDCPAAQ